MSHLTSEIKITFERKVGGCGQEGFKRLLTAGRDSSLVAGAANGMTA
jgi:hypothetical protein